MDSTNNSPIADEIQKLADAFQKLTDSIKEINKIYEGFDPKTKALFENVLLDENM